MFLVYNLVLLLLSPAIFVFILYRVLVSGKSRLSWREQLGLINVPPEIRTSKPIWIHAVSVGESVASACITSELKKFRPDKTIVVSTTTQTGQEMARRSVTDADFLFYYPFDLFPAVVRSLNAVNPSVFASTDTEIWPNFRHITCKMGVRSALVNGTISDHTMRGARWFPAIYRWAMGNIDIFCMQSQADANRAIYLGADPAKIIITGNCKADQAALTVSEKEKDQLRESYCFPTASPVFVAGSTNRGEDNPVLKAFLRARERHPKLKLVIAPRQIERRAEIAQMAASMGLICGWRSESNSIKGLEDVVILDTFGELAKVYAIADVTFVGGTLIPRGGHSLLQPIAQGKPVFFGPHTFKTKDIKSQSEVARVGFEVVSGDEMGLRISEMLDHPEMLKEIARRCHLMMQANLGASRRTAEALIQMIEQLPGGLFTEAMAVHPSKHDLP
jgi:3-deoxy-D-manno-octulosonic-acid transferase